MKTITAPQFHLRSIGFGILLCLAPASLVAADATPAPRLSGPPKVRVMVRENNIATTAGGTTAAATPAPGGAPNRPQGPGGQQQPQPPPGAAQNSALDAERYTHTNKKSLTIDVVNLTKDGMEVTVKATFLAKDEAGKHEVLPEKTVENKLTLQPGRPGEFTTEEVSFSHTTAHYPPMQPGSGGGGGGRGGGRGGSGGGRPLQMVPASGHAYFGYKVEVFQGNDLVGSAMSQNRY